MPALFEQADLQAQERDSPQKKCLVMRMLLGCAANNPPPPPKRCGTNTVQNAADARRPPSQNAHSFSVCWGVPRGSLVVPFWDYLIGFLIPKYEP